MHSTEKAHDTTLDNEKYGDWLNTRLFSMG